VPDPNERTREIRDDEFPKRIYLEPLPGGFHNEGQCWCQDPIENDWVEYHRGERFGDTEGPRSTEPTYADLRAELQRYREIAERLTDEKLVEWDTMLQEPWQILHDLRAALVEGAQDG